MDARRISAWWVFLLMGLLISTVGSAEAQSSPQAFVARAEEAAAQHRLGPAILNLERARLLSPDSRRIADDLSRARLAANLPPDEPRAAGTLAQLVRTEQWGRVALAGLGLTAGALTAVVGRRGRRAFLIIALVGGLVTSAGVWGTVRAEPPPNLAVVLSPDLAARVAPSREARAAFVPREGSLVSLERAQGGFVLIEFDGRRGWVPASDVEMILPES